ncbi:MAG TPA: TraM recognition domain-containing protein, partial [Candidatus Paceibacterota bacterium]
SVRGKGLSPRGIIAAVETFSVPETPRFKDAQEEIAWLRSQLGGKESAAADRGESVDRATAALDVVREHASRKPEDVYQKGALVPEHFRQEITLALSPEPHDERMAELAGILEAKGAANALDVVGRLNDAHLADDFHRFLVALIVAGYPAPGAEEKTPLGTLARRVLFELLIPETAPTAAGEKEEALKEIVGRMEQVFAAFLGVDGHCTVEFANPVGATDFAIYMSAPSAAAPALEKQVLATFPGASFARLPDDYNPFASGGVAVASEARLGRAGGWPLRTAESLDADPAALIVSALSRLDRNSEGAAVQLVIKPAGTFYSAAYAKGLRKLEKGEKNPEELGVKNTAGARAAASVVKGVRSVAEFFGSKKDGETKPADQAAAEQVKRKLETPIVSANIRVVASAADEARASSIAHDIEAAFGQMQNALGNTFKFAPRRGRALQETLRRFSFRDFDQADGEMPLSLREAATMFHVPKASARDLPTLRRVKASTAPAPLGLADTGVVLGTNVHQGQETTVRLAAPDRLRHLYTIGQTGTGKSSFLKQLILQDIKNGEGVCFVDPHGNDVQDILGSIPRERFEDVIYFDPSYTPRPMGLNMLEFDPRFPEQKTFVVNELFSIFKKLYSGSPESMGPAFEQYFRNSALLVMEHPESGCTLVDVSRVLSDKAYRDMKITNCRNPLVRQFWENAQKTSGEQSFSNYVQWVTNKFDVFLANEIMRPVVGQERSSFNFREIMDGKKILLVNLAKGRLGEMNSNLIGLILVGKILMAALSRVDAFGTGKETPPFYCYIDEFHNFTTDSVSTIFSEARKYQLSLAAAHQFIAQLEEGIRDSVFGNVGNIVAFRVSNEDAEFLAKSFAPVFSAHDLANVDNLNGYAKILAKGVPVRPFSVRTGYPPKGDPALASKLAELSYLTYGRAREEVEAEIMAKYQQSAAPAANLATPSA